MNARLYTPEAGVQDPDAFSAMLTRVGIDSYTTRDTDGELTIALDREGMEQLAAWFAAHGDAAQADAIERALDG